ncbi:MAG: 4a-hydroxytetrahydrobiopterin dehydratase [Actinomycetota bacterium]|nr:4a-hydroxytetrahydrobiopterin dehydratase [Actinomycetota bacterium]
MARMADEEIEARLEDLEGWERSGDSIRKQFKLDDFVGSVEFVNRLVAPAEDMGHHPDLEISWNKVTVSLSTHSQGGLTEADFDLAARIEAIGGEAAG